MDKFSAKTILNRYLIILIQEVNSILRFLWPKVYLFYKSARLWFLASIKDIATYYFPLGEPCNIFFSDLKLIDKQSFKTREHLSYLFFWKIKAKTTNLKVELKF